MEYLIVFLLTLGTFAVFSAIKRRRNARLASRTQIEPAPQAVICQGNFAKKCANETGDDSAESQAPSPSNSERNVLDLVLDRQTTSVVTTHTFDVGDLDERIAEKSNSASGKSVKPPMLPVAETKRGRTMAPEFSFLRISNLIPNSTPDAFRPNTRDPIRFECDSCSGEMFVMLRTNPLDPEFIWAFEKKRRHFELHIRVKFKMEPRGVVYLGGEIPRRMNLGFATDLACKGLLAVIRRLSSACHASFGDDAGEELPHIVFPLWHAADRLVVTKTGEPLPAIGKGPIGESDAVRAARFKDSGLGRGVIRKGDVVTFSFHSAYMDLVEWKLRGLGAIRDQSLSWFWGSLPLQVAVYDVEVDAKKHTKSTVRYYLRFEVKNTWSERGNTEGIVFPDGEHVGQIEDEDDEDDEGAITEDEDEEDGNDETTKRQGSEDKIGDDKDATQPTSPRHSARATSLKALKSLRSPKVFFSMLRRTASSSVVTKRSPGSPPTTPRGSNLATANFNQDNALGGLSRLQPLVNGGNQPLNDIEASSTPSRTLVSPEVPHWIRLRRLGGFDVVRYVLKYETPAGLTELALLDFDKMCRILPAASWRSRSLPSLLTANKKRQQKRRFSSALIQQCETRRRILDEECARSKQSLILTLDFGENDSGDVLRTGNSPPMTASRRFVGPDVGKILFESLILRQVSETYWQEEWLVLLRANHSKGVFCLFFLNKRTPIRIIPSAAIISVSCFKQTELLPLSKVFPALLLETLSKVKCLCFPSEEARTRVFDILNNECPRSHDAILASPAPVPPNHSFDSTDGNSEVASAKSQNLPETIPSAFSFALDTNGVVLEETYRWGVKKRIVLNLRKSVYTMSADQQDVSSTDLNEFVEKLLKMAYRLATINLSSHTSPMAEQIAFFNECSRLRAFDILTWAKTNAGDQGALKALFINLYHLILIHARHMVGSYSSSGTYNTFANQMSYEFGSSSRGNACVLSLAEIEHRILRPFSASKSNHAEPAPPSTPTTVSLALREIDPRITLALNRLCMSSDITVQVFTKADVEVQLDRVATRYIDGFLEIETVKKKVKVPKIIEWYSEEFGMDEPSARLAVGTVLRWVPHTKLVLLSTIVGEASNMNGSVPDLHAAAADEASSGGSVKFEFRKYHWQPRVRFELIE